MGENDPYIGRSRAYTGIGENRLRDITNDEQNLVLWVGTKRLIKRRALEKYIDRTYSV